MRIKGLQKHTLIDYPGKLAATVFFAECNFRCPWCYSPELVLPEKIKTKSNISEKDFFGFLANRQELLEGVVLCGGEPCINKDLPQFCKRIKKLGFLTKLDTNGSNPAMLSQLINQDLVDYVAMDIKAPRQKYQEATNNKANIKDIEKSINILKESDMDFEFRTTLNPLLNKNDVLAIAHWISPAPKYYLQSFRPEKTIDPEFEKMKPWPDEELSAIQKAIASLFGICQIR